MNGKRPVAVVTGSRADFGLLRPVMRAIARSEELELLVFVAGSHLVPPATTLRDVKGEFHVSELIPMQIAGRVGRLADAESVGKGVSLMARAIERHHPEWIVVLGDRIEAFAAALEKEYKTVRYKAYPNEGYYVTSLVGTRQMWLDMLDWFDRYLKD